MSEQDVTDGESSDPGTEDLDDIAEEPSGDTGEELADIAADGEDASADAAGDPAGEDEVTGESAAGDDGAGDQADATDEFETLVERVADADPEEIAREIDGLRSRVADLEETLADREDEVADLESRLKRKQADFQNYKKRQKERMEEEKRRATEDLVRRLLDVRDNLKRAVEADADVDVRESVETTLRQFDEQFERENVTPIEPEPGDGLDHERHEALATVPSDQPEGAVAEVHRPGYEMAGKVVRPAQVAVSDGSGEE